jgi:hypothetical protein
MGDHIALCYQLASQPIHLLHRGPRCGHLRLGLLTGSTAVGASVKAASAVEATSEPHPWPLRLPSPPSYNTPPYEALHMPFSIRPYRRFPVHCSVTYNAGPFQGQAPCGVSRVRAGDSPAICPCDQVKPSPRPTRSQMSNASRFLKPWSAGRGGRSLQWRILQSSRILAPGSSITSIDWCRNL